jgi:hypothetical protein
VEVALLGFVPALGAQTQAGAVQLAPRQLDVLVLADLVFRQGAEALEREQRAGRDRFGDLVHVLQVLARELRERVDDVVEVQP